MIKTIRSAWANDELRKKMLFTLLILVVFRLGSAIPVPFINTGALKIYFAAMNNTAFGLLNVMSGGAFSNATIFALSVQPYINASIIIQLLCIAIPALEHIAKEEGEAGRKKIENITRWTAVGIGLLQAFAYYMMINHAGLLAESATGVWWKAVLIILTFALGSIAIMFMGKLIDDKGIGNGISLILFAGIIARLPNDLITTVSNIQHGYLKWWAAFLVYLGMLGIIVLVAVMDDAERRIPVQYAKRVVGNKTYSGQNTYLPIKLAMSGVMPIIFAQTMVALPATVAAFLGKTGSFWARTDTWAYIVAYTALLVFFAFFYSSIQFNCIEVSNRLKNNGGMIPGYRPGKPTSEFLQSVLNRITMLGAVYLAIIVVIPLIVMKLTNAIALTGLSLGGTSVIIAVGVALQTIKDLETKLMTRNYTGLFRETERKHEKKKSIKSQRIA